MQQAEIYSVDDLFGLYGNIQTIAANFDCDPSLVSVWRRNGKLPAARQLQLLHILDNDKVLKMELAKARRARTRAARAK